MTNLSLSSLTHTHNTHTTQRLLVNLNDDMVAQFEDEDDFLIDLLFDNHKGHFNLCVQY